MKQYHIFWYSNTGHPESAVIWADDDLQAKARIEALYHCKVDHVSVTWIAHPLDTLDPPKPNKISITGSVCEVLDPQGLSGDELTFLGGEPIIFGPVNIPK